MIGWLRPAPFSEPLPANDVAGQRRLRETSPIPVALDESLRHPSDLATFVKLNAVDVAIAKVQRSEVGRVNPDSSWAGLLPWHSLN